MRTLTHFNTLGKPRAVIIGLGKWVKALMRGLYPIIWEGSIWPFGNLPSRMTLSHVKLNRHN